MIIQASIQTMQVTLMLILKICLSVEVNFWENLQSFPGKYLWSSSILVQPLTLRFTVILLMILKLMISIMILSTLTVNFFF